ncbi:MAG TPA: amino acid permease [Anaerolineales bacterium]|nr:amino acid permease [Anaerolineales bacterium]
MATTAGTVEVFTRKASGLVRVMSPYSAFVYNILTMGIIFPWVFLVSPTAFPGGNVPLGILICTLIQIPIAFSAVWLSTALPRSGGDYVFQSRVLGGGLGYTIVMSGFVIWILVWTALSGWLVGVLGIAPLLLGLGTVSGSAGLISAGLWATTPSGLFVISVLNGLIGAGLLVSGFKNYVRFQHILFFGTLIGFATTLLVLFASPVAVFAAKLNQFAAAVGDSPTFYQDALAAAQGAGVNTSPSFIWLATLLVAPVAWQSLQWSTYSAQQNGEIKEARSFRNQAFIMVGSLVVTGLLLAFLGFGLQRAAGTEGQVVASYGYWYIDPTAKIAGTIILAPSMLAVAVTRNPLLILLIGLGFTLNAFQIVCNCYIGVTRIMVAMSLDRLLPAWVSKVHERLHTPVNAHLVYFLLSIPIFALYSFRYGDFILFTLGVTFGCGYVFAATALSGAFLPSRAKALYDASPGGRFNVNGLLGLLLMLIGLVTFVWTTWSMAVVFANQPLLVWLTRLAAVLIAVWVVYSLRTHLGGWARGRAMPWVTALGVLGAGFAASMVAAFLLKPDYFVLGIWSGLDTLLSGDIGGGLFELRAQLIAIGVILVSVVMYYWAKLAQRGRGINVEFAFKEVPPE